MKSWIVEYTYAGRNRMVQVEAKDEAGARKAFAKLRKGNKVTMVYEGCFAPVFAL